VIMKVKNVSKALVFNLSMARLLAREHFKEWWLTWNMFRNVILMSDDNGIDTCPINEMAETDHHHSFINKIDKFCKYRLHHVVTCRGIFSWRIYRRVVDWMIGFMDTYSHNLGLQAIQRYRYLHTFS
jgi:hypothetical protein